MDFSNDAGCDGGRSGSSAAWSQSLGERGAAALGQPLSIYIHVPYCATRCGYCDFNTYTGAELGAAPGAGRDAYLASVRQELELVARTLGGAPEVGTVFVGGGTPTLLAATELAGLLAAIRERFPVAADAEVTTEANPETLSPGYLRVLADAGFTRLSMGMQSAVPAVLATLERRHTPGRVGEAVRWAREAGFADVSVDLIYATPGEQAAWWRESLDAAVALDVDHISAYSLTIEPGTRLAARVAHGELTPADDVMQAARYEEADRVLGAAGYRWYEISNWAQPGHECRHNLVYWRSGNWWGVGPGAHSHVEGVRWWNVRHPRDYVARLGARRSPAQDGELLDDATRRVERVLLEARLAEGLDASVLTASEQARLPEFERRGWIRRDDGVIHLSVQGRLMADAFVRDLLD